MCKNISDGMTLSTDIIIEDRSDFVSFNNKRDLCNLSYKGESIPPYIAL